MYNIYYTVEIKAESNITATSEELAWFPIHKLPLKKTLPMDKDIIGQLFASLPQSKAQQNKESKTTKKVAALKARYENSFLYQLHV